LRPGANAFLFSVGRGRLRASLEPVVAPIQFDLGDPTWPDYVAGVAQRLLAGVVVRNATEMARADLRARVRVGGKVAVSALPGIGPMTLRKMPVQLPAASLAAGETVAELELLDAKGTILHRERATLRVRTPRQSRKVTFVSEIDGSVQYFALQPAMRDVPNLGLVLTLHGASVEAIGQADAYAPKPDFHIVAATNRRPYGFDWEDWGRQDALEVLEIARRMLRTDPTRTYLTGHSMGGHGTWQLGVTFPDRWATIAPSAGWVSFFSYAGGARVQEGPAAEVMSRAANPSDTLALLSNTRRQAIYILHGDADDNVPVSEARTMRRALESWHPDMAWHEEKGAGHWWGNACVDWEPIFQTFRRTRRVDGDALDFVTANPALSARDRWLTLVQQERSLDFSRVRAERRDGGVWVQTSNVLAISLGPEAFRRGKRVEIDGQRLTVPGSRADLRRRGDRWTLGAVPSSEKNPQRAGPFKLAFGRRFVLVYGTSGTESERLAAWHKARYDAETWWYRGNGAVDVVSDRDFLRRGFSGRDVILYGHAQSNRAWPKLFGRSPLQIRRGEVTLGEKVWRGENLAVLACYPRPGSARNLVGVVAATGAPGQMLADRLPVFVSGVHYPDWTVIGTGALREGVAGILAAGFYGPDWR
jgi:dienelactone hydrolase